MIIMHNRILEKLSYEILIKTILIYHYIGWVAKNIHCEPHAAVGWESDMLDIQESVVKGRNYHPVTPGRPSTRQLSSDSRSG